MRWQKDASGWKSLLFLHKCSLIHSEAAQLCHVHLSSCAKAVTSLQFRNIWVCHMHLNAVNYLFWYFLCNWYAIEPCSTCTLKNGSSGWALTATQFAPGSANSRENNRGVRQMRDRRGRGWGGDTVNQFTFINATFQKSNGTRLSRVLPAGAHWPWRGESVIFWSAGVQWNY